MKKKTRKATVAPALPAIARQELTLLQSVLEEIARQYVARLQREIQTVSQTIGRVEKESEFTRKQTRDLQEIVDRLAQLNIRTEKGRRKDLKKIDALIGEIEKTVENW